MQINWGGVIPEVVTEIRDESGKLKKAVDFEKLKSLLTDSNEIVEPGEEHYEFTWVGKKEAMMEANKPIRKTLRPCVEESKDWDNTENLYIEGDNLEVLKLLQESYLNSIKMIYIDPPYNTGDDIIYKNNYITSVEEYEEVISEYDEEGNILYKNTDSNGRFHSDWCSMMFSRLKLAKNLLKDDGFFAIAIDHNELFNLGEMCDEIFGSKNRIGIISVVHKPEGRNQAKYIGPSNEFMLIYIKDDSKAKMRQVAIDDDQIELFNCRDKKGAYKLKNFIRLADGKYSLKESKPEFWYPIYVDKNLEKISTKNFENSIEVFPVTVTGVERTWKTTKQTCQERIDNGDILAKKEEGNIFVYEKLRENQVIKTHWVNKKYHGFHYGTKILDSLLGVKTFDFPKSLYLMHDIFKLFTEEDDIILDFFSGSATSAHAIMQLNAEDGHNRKFILAQIPASCDEKSEAYKSGYYNLCQIGKERIRRAGEQIDENKNLDVGFRVLKVDDSNMKDVYFNPEDYNQTRMGILESNIKEDRTDLDLLFGCLIDWGLPLNKKYESKKVCDNEIHIYNEGDLVACFDERVTEDTVKEIAKMEPLRVVFKDSSFSTSADKINVEEIFKLLSPDTSVRVI